MWALVVVFVSWGLGSVATSRKVYAGIIFGKKISVQEFNRSYQAVLNRAKMMYGDKLASVEKFLNLKSQAWDRLILAYAAKRKHIRSSNKEVIEKIASLPLFQRNGAFDDRLYDYIVTNVFGSTSRNFEESIRDDIAIEKLMDSVTRNTRLSKNEIRQAYRAENEFGDVSFILIKPESYKDQVSTDEEKLLSFYKQNKEGFRSLVSVNVLYLRIPFSDKKEDAQYAAEDILAEIKRGKNMEEVSKQYGLKLKESGLFSINSKIPEIGLSYPFALAALRLKKGEVSDVIETMDSFCIMQLKSKKPPSLLPFEEVKTKVRDALIKEKGWALAESVAERIAQAIADKDKTLEDASRELKLKISTAKKINKKSYIEEIGPSDLFTEAVFSLQVGESGGMAKTQKGYTIIRLDDLTPIDKSKFQEEKESFSKELLEKRKQEEFKSWFIELKKKAELKDNLSK